MKNATVGATDSVRNVLVSDNGSSTQRKRRVRRKPRTLSLDAEIRAQAKQIHESGFAEAMRAAALMIVGRKLDEVKSILAAAGLSGTTGISQNAVPGLVTGPQPAAQSSPPSSVQNPCVNCGRPGVYRTKPNQWNRTGSWWCRTHMVLAGQIEAEDKLDAAMPTLVPPTVPDVGPPPRVQQQPPQAQPPVNNDPLGTSSLAAAMGLAEVIKE